MIQPFLRPRRSTRRALDHRVAPPPTQRDAARKSSYHLQGGGNGPALRRSDQHLPLPVHPRVVYPRQPDVVLLTIPSPLGGGHEPVQFDNPLRAALVGPLLRGSLRAEADVRDLRKDLIIFLEASL